MDYYIFVREWVNFVSDSDFQFDTFNPMDDDVIEPEIESCALGARNNDRQRFKKLRRDKKRRVVEAVKKRETQIISRAMNRDLSGKVIPDPPPEAILHPRPVKRQARIDWSLGGTPGCQIAYLAGWTKKPLQRFGGLSPSRRLFLARVDDVEMAKDAVLAVTQRVEGLDLSLLVPRFGHIDGSALSRDQKVSIELSIDNPESTTQDEQELFAYREFGKHVREIVSGLQAIAQREGTASTGSPETTPALLECQNGDESAERSLGTKKKRGAGRPHQFDQKLDKRCYDAWKSGKYLTRADCAVALGVEEPDFVRAYDRHRKRLPKLGKSGSEKGRQANWS